MRRTASKQADQQSRMLEFFDREREVLLNGPLSELQALVTKREALLAAILADADPAPEGFLRALKGKAERNGRLLLASLAGLRAAREQIEQAEQAARTLRTYTAAGTSVAVSEPPKTRDQRR